MSTAPPPPKHVLRNHGAPVSALWVSDDNERVYSGDGAGTVVATSTRTLRALAVWAAHTDGVLGVQEWGPRVITHGRDNKLHVWTGPHAAEPGAARPACAGAGAVDVDAGSAALPGLHVPALLYSLDVNALNYCRFSLLVPAPPIAGSAPGPAEEEALLAVPNLVESAYADVWTLPGKQRLHAAIGKGGQDLAADGRDVRNPTGLIMSMHLSAAPHPSAAGRARLRLLAGYENGSVTAREYARDGRPQSVEGVGWNVLWTVKSHVESVMGMAVSWDGTFALSVSADHLIGKYNLLEAERPETLQSACQAHRTKTPGNAAVAIRDDGRVCAVGGWDGRVRLYSTKTFKPLGTLAYHKKNCQMVAFAHVAPGGSDPSEDEDMSEAEEAERARWLVSGGQDSRVAIWSLMDFSKT
ncbi:WD-40 repeat-containing protein [Epithele typhae]|uniref:WD-40 repeat-containing protein n=1 Tax=Epithele typhae TaxID=378194 RepID=UPI002007F98E|nr:WD-40 repeat-containing protein [Epithele typhae]KAH9945340.1 WD-40 repeat-containing protein [Epithele typhae]